MPLKQNKILIVDDDRDYLELLEIQLEDDFNVTFAYDGREGLDKLDKQGPFAVILSDMDMPGLDGVELLSRVREKSPDTVRILLSGKANIEDIVNVVNKGNIFRFLTKPCPHRILVQSLKDSLEQYQLIVAERELLEKTLNGSIRLLVEMMSITFPEGISRSRNIQREAHRIAVRLQMDRIWEIDIAALLSHIGCITLPPDIVRKKFKMETLSKEEGEMFARHPTIGSSLLTNIPRMKNIAEGVAFQNKCYNGQGYPADNVKGESINLIARILKVAGDFTALTSTGKTWEQAIELMRQRSFWYDPQILAALDSEIRRVKPGYLLYEIPAVELQAGMVLSEDLKNNAGVVLIPEGHELSEVEKIRIINLAKFKTIVEPIRVLLTTPRKESPEDYGKANGETQ